eukprot:tig00001307_g8123.t1
MAGRGGGSALMIGEECTVCRNSPYITPSLRISVSELCGHKYCETCIERMFPSGATVQVCKQCGTQLRKSNFKRPTGEGMAMGSETFIRKRVLGAFNKVEADFASLEEYNNYLEMVEDIIFNLVNGIDVEKMDRLVMEHQRENQEQIIRNQAKRAEAEREAQRRVAGKAKAREYVPRAVAAAAAGPQAGPAQPKQKAVQGGGTRVERPADENDREAMYAYAHRLRQLEELAARAGGHSFDAARARARREALSTLF